MTSNPARGSRRGFSLLESLTGLMIFSVAIVGIIEAVTLQLKSEAVAEDTTKAVMLAQDLVETLRLTGDLAAGEESDEFDGPNRGFESARRQRCTRLHLTGANRFLWCGCPGSVR